MWLNIKHSIKQNIELKIVSFSTDQTLRYEDENVLSFGVYYNSAAQKLSLLAI